MEVIKTHTLNLSNDSMTISGVKEVLTFENNLIVIALSEKTVTVKGENLRINELDLNGGKLSASGTVTGIMYSKGREKLSMLKKMFK